MATAFPMVADGARPSRADRCGGEVADDVPFMFVVTMTSNRSQPVREMCLRACESGVSSLTTLADGEDQRSERQR